MTDYFWPTDIIPGSIQWQVLDNTGVWTSPLNGATRTVSRPGTRMACTIDVPPLKGDQRYRMMGLLSALKGRSNRIWIPDVSTPLRGSFPTSELLSNTTFPNTTGWSISGSEIALLASSGRLRSTRSAATTDNYAYSGLTTVNGAQYLFRAGVIAGRGAVNFDLRLGSTNTGAELGSSGAQTAAAYKQAVGAATGTSSFANLKDIASGKAADYFQSLEMPSVSRCGLINGGSQTGSAFQIDALPNSTAGLAVSGDICSIYTNQWEMKRVVQDLNSNGSGQGTLIVEPACRVSPPDNSPICFYQPTARFVLADDSVQWSTQPGLFTPFQLRFVEDLG